MFCSYIQVKQVYLQKKTMKVSFFDIIKIAPIVHVKTNLTIKRIELIINNENELRLFGGKNGFLYAIKCENPDIDQIELYNDYCYIRSILNSIKHIYI